MTPSNFQLEHRGDRIVGWDRPGDGVALVLVHGNSCSKEAFRPLFENRELQGHRMMAPDLPGCGESANASAPRTTYSLPGLAETVRAVVAARGIDRYVLIGWSLGGHLAIEMLKQGARPLGVVLTGTPPCGPDPAEIAETFLPAPGSEVMSMEAPTRAQFAAFLKTAYAPLTPSAEHEAAVLRTDGRFRSYFFGHVYGNPNAEGQRTTVSRWPGPIALVNGRDEPFFDPVKLDALRWGNLWRGKTQWIDGAGHAPFASHPETYARVVREFVEEVG